MTYHANLCFSRVFTSRIVIRSFFSSEDFDDFANRYLVRAVDVLGILVAVERMILEDRSVEKRRMGVCGFGGLRLWRAKLRRWEVGEGHAL